MSALKSAQRRWRRWPALLVPGAMVALFTVGMSGASASTGILPGSPSNFESGDGNMTLEGTSGTDWNCFQGTTGSTGSAFATLASGTPAGCVVTSGGTQNWADGGTTSVGSNEVGFKGGTKFDTPCPSIIASSNPPKDEWTNVAEYAEASPTTNADGGHDLFFYGATIRPVVNGNSSGNVYFSQSTNGCHTVGDVLLAFDFVNGGGTPSLHALEWINSASGGTCFVGSDQGGLCWGNDQAINTTNFNGNVNANPIPGTANGINGTTLAANAFAEFGVNLTQAVKAAGGGSLPCFANQTWVSRSSGSSFTSSPEDVEVVNRPTCGKITIIKHTLNAAGVRSGVDQAFGYTTTGGLTPSTFSLNDKNGTDGAGNTQTYPNTPAGSYSVAEGQLPANFAFVGVKCTSTGSGTSTTTNGQTANISLGLAGNVVCTYTNQLLAGAIRINKTSSKAAATPLSGAKFFLCTNNTNSTSACVAAVDESGTTVTNPLVTDSNGTVCVGNLPFGSYFVFESAAPSGYATDDSSTHPASVTTSGDCSSATSASVTLPFKDTPLTDITATATSEVTGGTQSSITCVSGTASSTTNVGNSPQPPTGMSPSPSVLAKGLTPGTYTCTIVIDP